MPMRKTRAKAQRSRIGPTSRLRDLVSLLFSRPKCGATSNLVQAYFARRFRTQNRDFVRS